MKILILSDTHGNQSAIETVVEKEDADLCIHLGDNFRDAIYINDSLNVEAVAVKGNCDDEEYAEEDMVLDIEGHKIFLTHGHNYNVNITLDNLYYKAKSLNCHIALYGHTHKNLKENTKDLIIMNPGSLSKPRGCKASYGLLYIEEDKIEAKIIEL